MKIVQEENLSPVAHQISSRYQLDMMSCVFFMLGMMLCAMFLHHFIF